MRTASWRLVWTCAQHVPQILRRVSLLLLVGMWVGIMPSATQAGPVVRFDFNYWVDGSSGPINYVDFELYDTAAPITVANFLQYVNNGLYDDTIIHRNVTVATGGISVVQGGGFTPAVENGVVTAIDPITTYAPIQNEFSSSRSNVIGTIAMAKTSDPNSATSQWFVNVSNNSAALDDTTNSGGFTVFGKVLGDGMTLINAINGLTTYNRSQDYGGTFTQVPMFDNGGSFVTVVGASVISGASSPTASPGSLSGIVYVDTNHNGIMDGADYAIAGAQVSIMQAGSATPLATVYSA